MLPSPSRLLTASLAALIVITATSSCAQNQPESTSPTTAPATPSTTATAPTVDGTGHDAEPTTDGDTPVADGGYVAPTVTGPAGTSQSEPNPGAGSNNNSGSTTGTKGDTTTPKPSTSATPAGWEKITVDDWLTLTIPEEWKVVRSDADTHYLVDDRGNQHLYLLHGSEGQYAADNCGPELPEFTILDSQKSTAVQGENLTLTSIIEPVTWGSDTKNIQEGWAFDAGITHPELLEEGVCEPFFAIYSGETYMAVKLYADPWDGLYFKSEQEARAYAESKEYSILKQVMESAQINP